LFTLLQVILHLIGSYLTFKKAHQSEIEVF